MKIARLASLALIAALVQGCATTAFRYGGYLPFRPGERVVLTPQGLLHG